MPPSNSHPTSYHRTSLHPGTAGAVFASADHTDSGYGYNGHYRGRGSYAPRGYRGGARQSTHRHRSLVLNGAVSERPSDAESAANSDASQSSSWISKSDRHLQLINSAVYEKESQARAKAIEHTRVQKRMQKDERERSKLVNYLARLANSGQLPSTQTASSVKYEVEVEGIRFRVTKNGSKLVKVPGPSPCPPPSSRRHLAHHPPGDGNSPKATPKVAVVGGVKFYRTKNGNLYRHGVVKAQRYVDCHRDAHMLIVGCLSQSGVVRKVDVPCKLFSTTGIVLFPSFLGLDPSHTCDSASWDRYGVEASTDNINPCILGSCPNGPRCRYVHDPSKVAICKEFLQRGECANGDSCDLSHDPTPNRTPACLHFAKGNCTNPNCRYAHVKVSPGAPVCRPFGIYGCCDRGADCPDRHVFECPDFSNTGVCKSKGCKLLHRERASVLRKAAAAGPPGGGGDQDMEDVSSDDDGESVDSYDVDSDEVEEFIGPDDDVPDVDFATQKDFIPM